MSEERLRGVKMKVPGRWLEHLQRVLDKRRWTYSDLAREAGTSAASITRLIEHNNTSDAVISRVAAATGLMDPAEQLVDEELQRWVYIGLRYRKMDPRKFRMIMETMATTVDGDDALQSAFAMTPSDKLQDK